YWNGYECSGVIVDRYLYLSENGGMFFCINLDTMELVWAQDTLDDSNSTPVFEWDDEGNPYVYTAPSLHWTASGGKGSVNIFKLDANTGEIQWKMPFDCYTIPNTSGGVQASPVLGREGTDLEGIIVYPVAYTPHQQDGMLVAIDTKTGEKVWEHHMPYYTWSSPVAVYNSSGEACVIVCDSIGDVNLIDGKTGELLDKVNIGANVEASPSVYKDMLVVGTRGCRICGISIK
ncbi:MAG: PQQ-binding-like beta-propeller repeat protein, partial [Clostridia bacterium]|nr:PQQ-binding-like beta-propeller repeat protein [Clostridia bacterium]